MAKYIPPLPEELEPFRRAKTSAELSKKALQELFESHARIEKHLDILEKQITFLKELCWRILSAAEHK